MPDDEDVAPPSAARQEPIPRRARVGEEPVFGRRPGAVCEPAVVGREDVGVEPGREGGVVGDAGVEGARGGVPVQEEDCGVGFERVGDGGWGGLGGRGQRREEGAVEGVGEDEPCAEVFVVGSWDFDVEGFVGWGRSVRGAWRIRGYARARPYSSGASKLAKSGNLNAWRNRTLWGFILNTEDGSMNVRARTGTGRTVRQVDLLHKCTRLPLQRLHTRHGEPTSRTVS